jgi:nucleoside-diphosphate-sugar epimerase
MKVLTIGSDGFVGKHIVEELSKDHEVYSASRKGGASEFDYTIDLLDPLSIYNSLTEIKPEVIINCAGIVDNNDNVEQNKIFTTNLLEEIIASGLSPKRIIISGSAAEYGVVEQIPVNEETSLHATAGYGMSKVQETTVALEYRQKYNLPITIARIFNPIGVGMRQKFLVPQIIQQVQELDAGERDVIEVSSLKSKRDYIDIRDVARAIKAIIEGEPLKSVYNIGSGVSTSNGELIDMILRSSGINKRPEIKETATMDEPLYAIQADISRLREEFNFEPTYKIEDTVREITNATRQ